MARTREEEEEQASCTHANNAALATAGAHTFDGAHSPVGSAAVSSCSDGRDRAVAVVVGISLPDGGHWKFPRK